MRSAMELFAPVFDDERDAAAEAHAEDQRHRELDIIDALKECKAKGVSADAIRTLCFETGVRWNPKE